MVGYLPGVFAVETTSLVDDWVVDPVVSASVLVSEIDVADVSTVVATSTKIIRLFWDTINIRTM